MKVSPGMRLGRYEVGASIGAGGMGEVFNGLDTLLNRHVAIKVLPERVANDSDARQRFEREARLLASLSHPNILAIHDFGNEQGVAFAVMELLEGETLRQRLRRALPAETALDYALGIARGLAAAHAKGVIHRDLKPDNIFLPTHGSVKILDFGLARLEAPMTNEGDTGQVFSTQPGLIIGTVGYMSPEQLLGLDTGVCADIFSFGAVLHEMLSGRPPFVGSSVEVMNAVLNLDPPPLPLAMDFARGVVRTCLEKKPERRYQSAEDLVTALQAIRLAPAASPTALTTQWYTTVPSPAVARSIAVLPFADMSADKALDYLCEGIAEEILLALTKVQGLRVVARSSAFRFKGASEDARTVGRALGVDSLLEGSVRAAGDRLRVITQLIDTGDGSQLWSERFDRRLDDVFAVQDEIAAAVASTLSVRLQGTSGIHPAPARPQDPEAYRLYLKGRHHWNKRTEADLHRSVELFRASLEKDPGFAHTYEGLAEAYVTLGIYGALPPDEVMPMATAAAERALEIGPLVPGALATLGCVNALYKWSWIEAEAQFRRAIDSVPGASSAHAWYAMNHLVPLGRFDEARDTLERALAVDPLSLPIATALGVRAYYAHRYDEAATALSNALELDAAFPMAHYFLALVFTELGRHDEALDEIDKAMRGSHGSPEMTAAAGYALARAGNIKGARHRMDELLALANTRYVSPGLIAQIHAGLAEKDETLVWLERAVAVRAADVAWLGVRPIFDALRNDSRFHALQTRLGLDPPR
ncbi:MAG TPA: protein kinase [Vicinamibacterales bacterium]|nr:protein kinase [Vicinamibacterales bacterium]